MILLTDDGQLANNLTHPSFAKTKLYNVVLNKELDLASTKLISENGVSLSDGKSRLGLKALNNGKSWQVSMSEGRNRQIRRTFSSLGYEVVKLHRIQFGSYSLNDLKEGKFKVIKPI